jgi:EAL domain-containing protein (putative c-di-GMP-specific phosphodiesterase class I)
MSCCHTLNRNRVTVSIDDFGTGYSSLSSLKRLPIDSLKIDQSFLQQMNGSPDGAAIAIAIIRMGKSLNLHVVAEGVESVETWRFLRSTTATRRRGSASAGRFRRINPRTCSGSELSIALQWKKSIRILSAHYPIRQVEEVSTYLPRVEVACTRS